jgi:hypothetical protein
MAAELLLSSCLFGAGNGAGKGAGYGRWDGRVGCTAGLEGRTECMIGQVATETASTAISLFSVRTFLPGGQHGRVIPMEGCREVRSS